MRRRRYVPLPPAKPIALTEPVFIAAREALTRAAVKYGRQEAGSIELGKMARDDFDKALTELRRSEQREGIHKACSEIESALRMAKHNNPNSARATDYKGFVLDCIKKLTGGVED